VKLIRRFIWFGLSLACSTVAARAADPFSADAWRTAAPEEVGIDSAPLVELMDFIRERHIPVHSIQLVRRGPLVLDAYVYPDD